jgi:hypothetical protein
MLRDVPQGTKQRHDVCFSLVSQAINHAFAVALRADQPGTAQLLEVLRGVRHGEADPLGQRFNAARTLRQLLNQLHAVLVAERFGHLGKCRTDGTGGGAA